MRFSLIYLARRARVSAIVLLLAACDERATAPEAGAAWESDQRLTHAEGASLLSFNFARSVAVDDRAGVHLVWYDERSGTPQVFYLRSQNAGVSWSSEVSLAFSVAAHPAIASSESGVYAVWHSQHARSDVLFRRSRDRGNTWDPEVRLSASGKAAHSSVAASGNRVYAVWGDLATGNAEVHFRASSDGGATWSPEIRISDTPYESWVPTVAAAGDTVLVAWVDYSDANEEEYVRASYDGGRTWGAVTRLTIDDADSWAPSLVISGAVAHIAWFDRRDIGISDADIESVLDETIRMMGLPAQPTPPRSASSYYLPLFTTRIQQKMQSIQRAAPDWVAMGGDPMLLERRLREFEQLMKSWSEGWEIYYKRSTDAGRSWSAELQLTRAQSISARPSLALSGDDLHLVWYDARDGDIEIYYKHSPDAGLTWEPDLRLTTASGVSAHPSIAADRARLHVVWFDERAGNSEIFYKRGRR